MVSKSPTSWAAIATLFASQALADAEVPLDKHIFLTASQPEGGLINYIEMYEHHGIASHLQAEGNWRPLITGLKYPTATAYDFTNKWLYVCDCDEILQYQVDFAESQGEHLIYTVLNGPVARGMYCGGLAIDKFNNLFVVDTQNNSIHKLQKSSLARDEYPVENHVTLYTGEASKTVRSVQDIDIEQEYLYWANDSHFDGHGGVHKAFTEPFIKAEPFQTYEIRDVEKASWVTTNENYLFFTGNMASQMGRPEKPTELFIQKKQGAGLFYHFGDDETDKLRGPGALLTYKDTLLLVANEGFISMLDMTKFPPLPTDFKDYTIEMVDQPSVGSNTICAGQRPITNQAYGMSFISMYSDTVNEVTLANFAGQVGVTIGSLIASLLLVSF